MNDTDSLQVMRLRSLRIQPKTIRGKCILFYASLNEKPCVRIMLATAFFLFILLHCGCFCVMVYYCYEVSKFFSVLLPEPWLSPFGFITQNLVAFNRTRRAV